MSGCEAPTGTRFALIVVSGTGESCGEPIARDGGEPGAYAGDVGEDGPAMLVVAMTTDGEQEELSRRA